MAIWSQLIRAERLRRESHFRHVWITWKRKLDNRALFPVRPGSQAARRAWRASRCAGTASRCRCRRNRKRALARRRRRCRWSMRTRRKPPKGAEGIEWLLITTLPVTTNQQAREVVDLYGLRWRIEGLSPDPQERLRCREDWTAERIKRAVTINAIIAYRLAALTLLGRETPGTACRCSRRLKSRCCARSNAGLLFPRLPRNPATALQRRAKGGRFHRCRLAARSC